MVTVKRMSLRPSGYVATVQHAGSHPRPLPTRGTVDNLGEIMGASFESLQLQEDSLIQCHVAVIYLVNDTILHEALNDKIMVSADFMDFCRVSLHPSARCITER